MRPRALGMNAGWRLQSSAKLHGAGGDALSRPGIDTAEWLAVDLPATVLGALVDSGAYGDPFHATKLREILKGARRR